MKSRAGVSSKQDRGEPWDRKRLRISALFIMALG
jgi:hypothetical protein